MGDQAHWKDLVKLGDTTYNLEGHFGNFYHIRSSNLAATNDKRHSNTRAFKTN